MKIRSITITAALGAAALTAGCGATPGTPTPQNTDQLQSCWAALDAGRDAISLGADTLGLTTDIINLMPDALEAAVLRDADRLDELTTQVSSINDQIVANTDELDPEEFQALAAACEAGR